MQLLQQESLEFKLHYAVHAKRNQPHRHRPGRKFPFFLVYSVEMAYIREYMCRICDLIDSLAERKFCLNGRLFIALKVFRLNYTLKGVEGKKKKHCFCRMTANSRYCSGAVRVCVCVPTHAQSTSNAKQ